MAPKIVDKEAKRLEIMQAAIHVFAQNGIVRAKMIDIARSAGVGKGTVYEYFRSKEEIFAAAFSYYFNQMEVLTQKALELSDEPRKQLENLICVTMEAFFKESGDFLQIMMDFWAEGIRNKDERLVEAIDLKGIYRQYRQIIIAIIEKGIKRGVFRPVDSVAMASFLIASMDGLMLQWIMEPDLFELEQVEQALIDGFLNGLSKNV
jgi:AcrR family transcriptional regulator